MKRKALWLTGHDYWFKKVDTNCTKYVHFTYLLFAYELINGICNEQNCTYNDNTQLIKSDLVNTFFEDFAGSVYTQQFYNPFNPIMFKFESWGSQTQIISRNQYIVELA